MPLDDLDPIRVGPEHLSEEEFAQMLTETAKSLDPAVDDPVTYEPRRTDGDGLNISRPTHWKWTRTSSDGDWVESTGEDAEMSMDKELLRTILKASEKDAQIITPKPGDILDYKEGDSESEIRLLRKEVERQRAKAEDRYKVIADLSRKYLAVQKQVSELQALAAQHQRDYTNLRNDVDTAGTFEYVRRLERIRRENAELQKAAEQATAAQQGETGKRLKQFEDAVQACWDARKSYDPDDARDARVKLFALIGKKL